MGYIPPGAKWYLAEIVEEITVEGSSNVVHTNTVLIRADSPEEAYERAVEVGTSGELSYENLDGKSVTIRFRGLYDLNVIHYELEHGAELTYFEEVNLDESAIEKLVTPKEELGVFRPITPSTGPDYRSRDVMERIYEQSPHLRPGGIPPSDQ